MYFDSLAPINLCLYRTILSVPVEIQLISVSEAVIGAIAVKEAPVEVLEEDVDGLPKFIVLPDLVRMMGRMLL